MLNYSIRKQIYSRPLAGIACCQYKLRLSQAAMKTPAKQELFGQSLFEIPSCSICLAELSDDLASLDCGHVFHVGCISQNFQYRGACPNCQKRACAKEIRTIHFRLVRNTKINAHLRTILASVDASERKQIQALLNEIRILSESNEKMTSQITSVESDLKTKSKNIDNLNAELHKKKGEAQVLRRQNLKMHENIKGLSQQLSSNQKIQIRLRIELDKLKKDEKQYEQLKRYKKFMYESSQQMVRYKSQLQSTATPSQQIARIFFDIVLMKSLQILKAKDKLKQFQEKVKDHEFEVSKLKNTIQTLKKEIKENNQKRNMERTKYEALKSKYRVLCDKAKLKGLRENDIPEIEDSQGFANINKNYHIPEDPVVQQTLRRPAFNQTGASTIGGFFIKKKDDKIKILI